MGKDEKALKTQRPKTAKHVTNRVSGYKGRPDASQRQFWLNDQAFTASSRGHLSACRGPRQQLADLDCDAVAVDHQGALGHRQIVGEDVDGGVLRGIQFDDGAAAELERLMHWHGVVPSTMVISTATLSNVAALSSIAGSFRVTIV
jgi:hypothetical protein